MAVSNIEVLSSPSVLMHYRPTTGPTFWRCGENWLVEIEVQGDNSSDLQHLDLISPLSDYGCKTDRGDLAPTLHQHTANHRAHMMVAEVYV